MKAISGFLAAVLLTFSNFGSSQPSSVETAAAATTIAAPIFGFRDPAGERAAEARFLAVPDAKLAGQHLKTLTQAPHIAGSPEDKATAEYRSEEHTSELQS